MSNKKAQAMFEFLMTYGWAILVVIVAVGALWYFEVLRLENFVPFDKNKHDCLEWKYPPCKDDINSYELGSKERDIIINNCAMLGCKKKRTKPKCELDPESEDCICDRYEKVLWDCEGNTIKNENEYKESMKEKKVSYTIFSQKKCIQSHEANECEKENPEYIDECQLYRLFAKDNSSFNGLPSYLYTAEAFESHKDDDFFTKVTCEKSTCRKKHMYDLTCIQLQSCYHLQFDLCPIEVVNEKDILFAYLDKCINNPTTKKRLI